MTLEYDTNTRRVSVQIPEDAYRALEKEAEKQGRTVASLARDLFEEATKPMVKALTPEDELIVLERVRKNIEKRMKARTKNK